MCYQYRVYIKHSHYILDVLLTPFPGHAFIVQLAVQEW